MPCSTPVAYKIGPAGATAALDIGLSNAAIATEMHINLYTICKSTVVVFVLLFGILFKIQKPVSNPCTICTSSCQALTPSASVASLRVPFACSRLTETPPVSPPPTSALSGGVRACGASCPPLQSWQIMGIIFLVVFGVILFQAKDDIAFHSTGFILVIFASMYS